MTSPAMARDLRGVAAAQRPRAGGAGPVRAIERAGVHGAEPAIARIVAASCSSAAAAVAAAATCSARALKRRREAVALDTPIRLELHEQLRAGGRLVARDAAAVELAKQRGVNVAAVVDADVVVITLGIEGKKGQRRLLRTAAAMRPGGYISYAEIARYLTRLLCEARLRTCEASLQLSAHVHSSFSWWKPSSAPQSTSTSEPQ